MEVPDPAQVAAAPEPTRVFNFRDETPESTRVFTESTRVFTESTTLLSRFLGTPDPDPVPASREAPKRQKRRREVLDHRERRLIWHVPENITAELSAASEPLPSNDRLSPTLRYVITWSCISDIISSSNVTEWSLRYCFILYTNYMVDALHSHTYYTDPMYAVYATWGILHNITMGTRVNVLSFPETYERFTGLRLDSSFRKVLYPLLSYVFSKTMADCRFEVSKHLAAGPIADDITCVGTMLSMVVMLVDERLARVEYLLEDCRIATLILTKGILAGGMPWGRFTHLVRLAGLREDQIYTISELRIRLSTIINLEITNIS